jgi:2-alkyl-3-oxoalkanoate reductase
MSRLAAVTGATGFLGRYVVRALAASGWRVRLLARRPVDHPQLADLELEIVRGDLADGRALRALVEGADAVVHAAGLIKARSAADFRAVNVAGASELAAAIRDAAPAARVLMVSTLAAREPHLSHYARTKRAGEEMLIGGLGRRSAWAILRPCAIYGPWDRETLAIFRAIGRGVCIRPHGTRGRVGLIHAEDAASAIARLAGDGPAGAVLELTDERTEGYSWQEIIVTAAAALEVKVRTIPLPGLTLRTLGALNAVAALALRRTPMLTPGKAREILHSDWGSTPERQPPRGLWRPTIDLARGFRETVSWYRARQWLPAAASTPAAGHILH